MKTTELTARLDLSPHANVHDAKSKPCLIVVSGHGIGQRFWLLDGPISVGRHQTNHIVIADPSVSRRHARLLIDGDRVLLDDLNSTNGTFVNLQRLHEPRFLCNGDLILVGEIVLKFSFQSSIEEEFFNEMIEAARIDGLTGLLTRRHFDRQLQAEFARIDRYGGTASLLLCDLDDFKRINDQHGHQGGDLVLKSVADAIYRCLRKNLDISARFGGDEIAVLLPEIAEADARAVAEKIRLLVAGMTIEHHRMPVSARISIGVATVNLHTESPQKLIALADANLYHAKATGKNCVIGARSDMSPPR